MRSTQLQSSLKELQPFLISPDASHHRRKSVEPKAELSPQCLPEGRTPLVHTRTARPCAVFPFIRTVIDSSYLTRGNWVFFLSLSVRTALLLCDLSYSRCRIFHTWATASTALKPTLSVAFSCLSLPSILPVPLLILNAPVSSAFS